MNNNEHQIKWSNFKKIFDKNPVLIFETNESLLEKIPKTFDFDSEDEIDEDEQQEEVFSEEEIETLIEKNLWKEAEFNAKSYEEISHNFDWFDIDDQKNTAEFEEKYIVVKANAFNKYKLKAIEFYLNKNKINPSKVKYISIKNNLEARIALTKEMLSNIDVDVIINPCFETKIQYKDKTLVFQLNNSIYDKKAKKIIDINYRSTTLVTDNYKCLYTYLCLKKNEETKDLLEDYSVIIIDPLVKTNKNFLKNEIIFYEAFASVYNENKTTSKSEELSVLKKILIDSGLIALYDVATNTFDTKNSKFTFFNTVKYNNALNWKNTWPKGESTIKYQQFDSLFQMQEGYAKNNGYIFETPLEIIDFYPSFEYFYEYLNKTIDEFKDKKLNREALKYFCFSSGDFKNNSKKFALDIHKHKEWFEERAFDYKFLNKKYEDEAKTNDRDKYSSKYAGIRLPKYILKDPELKNALLNYLVGEDYAKLSGNYYNLGQIIGKDFIDFKNKKFFETDDYFNFNIANFIRKLHIKDARVVWYDYEGFSELFPIMDHLNPYNQIINQVSVIVTKNGQEEKCVNIVKDTKNIKLQDLCEMIEEIYSNKADYFVVFNKNYENTRNKEILEFVRKSLNDLTLDNVNHDVKERAKEFANWFFTKYSGIEDFAEIINHINNNTIDLADCFATKDIKKVAQIMNFNQDKIDEYYLFAAKDGKIINEDTKGEDFVKKNSATFQKMMISIKFLKYFFSIKKIEKYITENKIILRNMIKPYSSLKEVQKGTDAMEKAIQRYLGSIGDNLWNDVFVPNLKIYCENDVRAMMMVYDFVIELIKSAHPEIVEYEYKLKDENDWYIIENNKIKTIKL
ncbi:UU173 family protein [Mycoplasmopsis glycophila]|uniref:Domain of uncharacterized function(DUF2779) n=1 Tax=Mycoplasmopsis glycophila TaxID=171285 RepID=A0A449AU28_9BACT|nr:DUF2779 domain-containing protein [Mycoplasmopsis glycophila]VEU70034.1 Domain of uncharacterised function(DUF2779) [Mycoplasmopsis glycophila]